MRVYEKLKVSFTLQDALAVILKASGLKHDDYERYRDFCARQIRLIRKGKKPAENVGKRSRKRAAGKPITSSRLSPSEKDLLLLLKSERAFAQAMVYRRDSADEPRKVYHARKRWKRAEEIASRLANQRKKHTPDFRPFLHYRLLMRANRFFEYHKWGAAIKNFDHAIDFFGNRQDSGETMKMRVRLMESLQRYCAHMKARTSGTLMDLEGEDGSDIELMEEDSVSALSPEAADSCDWFGFTETNKLAPKDISDALASGTHGLPPSTPKFWDLASTHLKSYYILIRSYACWKRRLSRLEGEEINDFLHHPKGGRLTLIRALGAKARSMCKKVDRFLAWNRNPEFVRDMTAMNDCLRHFAVFLTAGGRTLRGKLNGLSTDLPPPKDFRISFLDDGPSMENSGRFHSRWQLPLRNIAAAFTKVPSEYEMTPYGPQPIRRHASFLETLDEFRLFKRPHQAIFSEENFAEIIPMKPIFYDLAYDMLDDPEAA